MKNYVELVGCCPPQPSASVDNTPSIYIILHTIKNVGVNVAFVLTFSCIYLSHFTSLYLIKTENRNSFLWTNLCQTITKSLIIEKTNISTRRFLIDFSRLKTLTLLLFKRYIESQEVEETGEETRQTSKLKTMVLQVMLKAP